MLYNFAIHFYSFLIFVASLFQKKAFLLKEGRKNIFSELDKLNLKNRPVWIHASSLGEFEQGRPLIEEIKKRYPEQEIVLTFFSPSGYTIRKNYPLVDGVLYLPADTKRNAKRFVKILNPKIALFIKYEFWRNFLQQLQENNVPTYLISGIFRPSQAFFKWYGKPYQRFLTFFSHFFVQNELSFQLLDSIGIQDKSICGDTRFDRVADMVKNVAQNPIFEAFKQNSFTIVAGSTWADDEELILNFMNEYHSDINLIIAPHEIDEDNIKKIIKNLKCETIRYTKIDEKTQLDKVKVLIIDNIGTLSSAYRYGEIAYIGGGFGNGIHNILEAATYGIPIVFGVKYEKFQEAVDLVKLSGAFSIKSYVELYSLLDTLITDKVVRCKSGNISANYVQQNKGGTSKIMDKLQMFFEK